MCCLCVCVSVSLLCRCAAHAPPRSETSPPLLTGFLLEIVSLYYTSGAHKWAPEWREDYTAAFYAVSLTAFRSRLGEWLAQAPELCKVLTYVTIKWELLGPWLFISPVLTEWARLIAVLGFFGMHLGFHLMMHLSLFLYAFGSVLVCFLPGMVWDSVRAAPVSQHPHA